MLYYIILYYIYVYTYETSYIYNYTNNCISTFFHMYIYIYIIYCISYGQNFSTPRISSGHFCQRQVRMGENALVEMPFTVTINTGASWRRRNMVPWCPSKGTKP